MLSDNDKKNLELIESLVNLAKSKLNDSYFVQSTFADLRSIYENLDDKNLKYNINMKVQELLITFDNSKLKKYIDELLFIISKTRETNKTYLGVPSDDKHVIRNDRYKDDCKKYADKKINESENKILDAKEYVEHFHKKINRGIEWKGCLHARLTKNLRIIYRYDEKKKTVEFLAIITHDDYDL